MTDNSETYRPTSFCWVCGRKLWHKNKPTVRVVDGHPRTMHKFCSKHFDWINQQEGLKEGKDERY